MTRHLIGSGEWTHKTAGGCRNYSTHLANPQYLLSYEDNGGEGGSEDCECRVLVQQDAQEEFDDLGMYGESLRCLLPFSFLVAT